MSDDVAMSADIIPTGDRGQFRITDQMMYEAGAVSMGAFEVLLHEEARRRGLDLRVELEVETQDVIVQWRPGSNPTGPAETAPEK